jgi:predicted nucleic acid-binding protein
MSKVFIDTAAWLALINKDDKFHLKAKAVRDRLVAEKLKFTTTSQVIIEVANGLSKPPLRQAGIKLIESIKRSPDIRVIHITERLHDKAWAMYKSRGDKEWSLADCMSFIVMREEGVAEAFTTDRHFEQAGFVKLL